ncbi:MAG: hypothetical protein K1060chlam5_00386 [Candidatus Anoxychlamydiales bacterium]|nr:hypothetical protein [Candidatus Anoxychlamydiales bacterium]
MAVKAVEQEVIIRPSDNTSSKKKSNNMGNASVFLCIAEAMKDKLDDSTQCLKMSKDEREQQIIENALQNAKDLDESKFMIDQLIKAAQKSGDVNLSTWLEGLKDTVTNLIGKRNKAYADFLKSLKELQADESLVTRLEDDIAKNKKLLTHYEKDLKKAVSNLPGKCDLERIIADSTYIASYAAIIEAEKATLVIAKTKLGKEILDNEVFKDLAGDGNGKDWLDVRNTMTIILMNPLVAAVFDTIVTLITGGKETGIQLIDKGYDALNKEIKKGLTYINKKINADYKDWNSPIGNYVQNESPFGMNDPAFIQYPRKYLELVMRFGGGYTAEGLLSTASMITNNKNQAFEKVRDTDKANSKTYLEKAEALDSSGLHIVENQTKIDSEEAQKAILQNQKAQNDFTSAIEQLKNISKVFSQEIK